MANYSNLAATINAQIKANGNQEITGPVLNAVLTAMVTVLGDGYRLQGVAAPADNPGSPDNRVAYLASQDGTYTNFGGLVVSGEVALLLWDAVWTKATLVSIDAAVTPGSDNLITSDAVNSAISALATQYMALVPAATEGNLAEFDNAGQVRDAGLATSDLATKDGHYPDLFAGFAGNLVDTRSAGTRQGPFAFRQSGGDGVNYMRKILGRTEVWDQLVDFSQGSHPEATISSGLITVNATVPAGQNRFEIFGSIEALAGHKYLLSQVVISGDMASTITYFAGSANSITGTDSRIIDVAAGATSPVAIMLQNYGGSDAKTFSFSCYILLVDLTLEGLGLTTADQFRALHPLPYYNYNAGVLKNNAATGLETTGFNQWDEEIRNGYYNPSTGEYTETPTQICSKNPISVFTNTEYYILNGANIRVLEYDINGNFIGTQSSVTSYTTSARAAFITINLLSQYGTTYNHDVCINISDPSRNGTYEPYWKRDIVLGLNNLACHDENNNAVTLNGLDGVGSAYDEAVVENGYVTKIIKKMAALDWGDLEWQQSSAAFYAPMPSDSAGYSGFGSNARSTYLAGGKYNKTIEYANLVEGGYCIANSSYIYVKDSSYATPAAFKAAVEGIKMVYELATPKVLTLDNPIPALIEVDNLGTEKRLPEDTADNPQAPFECDSNYSVSTANLVRLLNL